MRLFLPLFFGLVVVLSGCGGGSGDAPTPAPPPATDSWRLSGTVTASALHVLDVDTNDPRSPQGDNNSPANAQTLPSLVTVGGYVTATPTAGGINGDDRFSADSDKADYFRINLQQGQPLMLEIADWSSSDVDLDLYLYDALSGELIDAAMGLADIESLQAPADGDYLLQVYAETGRSNYLLKIDSAGTALPVNRSLRLSQPFFSGELLLQLKRGAQPAARSAAGNSLAGPLPASAEQRPVRARLGASPQPRRLSGQYANDEQAAKLATLLSYKQLSKDPAIALVALNYQLHSLLQPTDPLYRQQWHYPAINLPEAWDYSDGQGALVAVVDSGVYLQHPDLAANLSAGYDFIADSDTALDGDGLDDDANDPGDGGLGGSSSWHGTHVAGTIAAVANNGQGGSGVAYGAQIMPLRALGLAGGGSSYDVQQAVRYAAGLANDSGLRPERRADIINLSVGCSGCYSAIDEALFDAVHAAGVIVIAAAGNDNSNVPSYPAAYPKVISVAATDRNDARAYYSNYGSSIDVSAPGGAQQSRSSDGVLSTLVDESAGALRPSYEYYQGTSMAAPHVAGVAALMVALHPALTPDDFAAALSSGAIVDDLGSSGRDNQFGYGRINARKAVEYAQQLAGGEVLNRLSSTPAAIDLGLNQQQASLHISSSGTPARKVISTSSSADWLQLSPLTIDEQGLGEYQLTVDRSQLGSGSHSANLIFNDDQGDRLLVNVSVLISAQPGSSGIGHLWFQLYDSQQQPVAGMDIDADANGRYHFNFAELASGEYLLLASTDSDNDYLLCDSGEACGVYPTIGLPTLIQLNSDRTGLDFQVLLGSSLANNAPLQGNRMPATATSPGR